MYMYMTLITSCVNSLRTCIQEGWGWGVTIVECKPSFVSVRKMFASKRLSRELLSSLIKRNRVII